MQILFFLSPERFPDPKLNFLSVRHWKKIQTNSSLLNKYFNSYFVKTKRSGVSVQGAVTEFFTDLLSHIIDLKQI